MINSIFGRVVITSVIFLVVLFFSLFTAIMETFKQETLTSQRQQIELQNNILLSAATIDEDKIVVPDEISEHRFELYESGVYGYVTNSQNQIIWRSYSAHSIDIEEQFLHSKSDQIGVGDFQEYPGFFAYHYNVIWEVIDDSPDKLTFTVLVDRTPTLEKIKLFQSRVRSWFIGLALGTAIVLIVFLRWLTKPLRCLTAGLKAVESGRSQQLEGRYPSELQPVVDELNNLITAERKQRERYRNTLANLAHSLKTPLAVIQTELDTHPSDNFSKLIDEQASRMEEIIRHQLQRAVLTQGHQLGSGVSVAESVEKITKALNKVYVEKNIQFSQNIGSELKFTGDQRDLLEVLGNILDNACKACDKKISIIANAADHDVIIAVHDDGPGIAQAQRERVLERGERIDSQTSGQGLGLDISRDIIDSYGGSLQIQQSPLLGGALFRIELPGH